MNIAEILKDCPKGTKLYSPIYGELELIGVEYNHKYPIACRQLEANAPQNFALEEEVTFTEHGRYLKYYPNSECMLFPSKDQRDWNKFIVPDQVNDQETKHQLKPFDKVLVRDGDDIEWRCDFFSHLGDKEGVFICLTTWWKQCIPYEGNEHLLGTTKKPEE